MWSEANDDVLAGLVFSLGAFATVFQAEVFAIMAAIHESIMRGYNSRTITIFTDSQAALKCPGISDCQVKVSSRMPRMPQ